MHYARQMRSDSSRPKCAFPGCVKALNANGLCTGHYQQQLRSEEPHTLRGFGLPIEDRLKANLRVDLNTGCMVWTGSLNRTGYGTIGIEGKSYLVHRVSWESVNGPVPSGLVLDHLCRNPPCFNPTHLEPVTNYVNVVIRGQGAAAKNLKKTRCHKGHPLMPDPKRPGWRYCLVCESARKRVR